MVGELDDGLAHLNDPYAKWGFHLDPVLQERSQQTFSVGDTGDKTAERMSSSQGGTGDASLGPAARGEGGLGAASVSGTDRGSGWIPPRSCLGGKHTSSATGGGSPRQYGTGPRLRANVLRVNLLNTSED